LGGELTDWMVETTKTRSGEAAAETQLGASKSHKQNNNDQNFTGIIEKPPWKQDNN
jgi:hypothetical protein